MRFGIEIEAIGMTVSEARALLRANGVNVANTDEYTHDVVDGWKVVRDGSVAGGFELVSPPLEYNEENLAAVKSVIGILNDAGCDVNRSCGYHVHFEVKYLTPEHIANVYNRYRRFELGIDELMPNSRRRSNNNYCRSITDLPALTARDTIQETIGPNTSGRYFKVNLSSFIKYGTIEFRQHSGTVNAAKVIRWVQFLHQFIEASHPLEMPASGMRTEVRTITEQVPVTQPIQTAVSRQSTSLRGMIAKIVRYLENRAEESMVSRYATAQEIATAIGSSSAASVQSAICRGRAAGVRLTSRTGRVTSYGLTMDDARAVYGANRLTTTTYQTVTRQIEVQVPVSSEQDNLWRGISSQVVEYYNRRRSSLRLEAAA